jgi:hypothetical protein
MAAAYPANVKTGTIENCMIVGGVGDNLLGCCWYRLTRLKSFYIIGLFLIQIIIQHYRQVSGYMGFCQARDYP